MLKAKEREAIKQGFFNRDPEVIGAAIENNSLSLKSMHAGQIDRENYTITFVGTRDSVDRDGERILPRAFEEDFGHYLQNPIVLFNHDLRQPAVGRMEDYDISDTEILMRVKFAHDENPMAALLWRLYSAEPNPYMRMVSMCCLPLEGTNKPDMKLPGQKKMTFTRVEMLELSLVNVGANRYALSMLMKAVGDDPIMKSAYSRLTKEVNLSMPGTTRNGTVVLSPEMGLPERLEKLVSKAEGPRAEVIERMAEAAYLEIEEVEQVLSGDTTGLLSKQIKGFSEVLEVDPEVLIQAQEKGVKVNGYGKDAVKAEDMETSAEGSFADKTKNKYYYGRYYSMKPKGSMEKIRGQVASGLESYLPLKLPNAKRYNYVDFDVVGTFMDHVIVCVYNYEVGFEKSYRIGYMINDEGMVEFGDEMVEVEQEFVEV